MEKPPPQILQTPKVLKRRITATQFDIAVAEEIRHAQGMNIPKNSISSVASFCVLVGNRLFGQRGHEQRTDEFNKLFQQVMVDAQIERAEYETHEREQRRQQESRIVLPPGARLPGSN